MDDDDGMSPPPTKKQKTDPKKKKKKETPPPPTSSGPVQIITDIAEWERLLRDVPLKTGEIRFYRGKGVGIAFT